MARGILFDFNGTLFFDSELHVKAFEKIFTMYGKSKPTREFLIERILGRTNSSIYLDNFDPNGDAAACDKFRRDKEEAYYELCLSDRSVFRLVDGAAEMLDHLKERGIPFTIATGSGEDEVDFFFKHLGLGRWFEKEKMVFTDGSFSGKPAPDCYLLAAKKIGLPAEECIVFEDGTSGVTAAKRAGVEGVVVVHEITAPSPLVNGLTADAVCHDLSDWRNILLRYGLM